MLDANRMNFLLAKTYQEYLDEINSKPWAKGTSSPLLMHVPEDYCRMGKRIMFVGQETHTWMDGIERKHSVQTLQDAYKYFDLGKHVKYGKRDSYRQLNSQFWNFLRHCFTRFNRLDNSVNQKTSGFLWTNISKFDFNGGTPTKSQNVSNPAGFNLLLKEIQIVKPDVIVLLVGRKYDDDLKALFQNEWEKVDEDGILSVYTGVCGPSVSMVFKTMHPTYLCRIKKNKEIINLMENLVLKNCHLKGEVAVD